MRKDKGDLYNVAQEPDRLPFVSSAPHRAAFCSGRINVGKLTGTATATSSRPRPTRLPPIGYALKSIGGPSPRCGSAHMW